MIIDDLPHPHSFLRDGTETRNAEASAKRGAGITVRSGIQGLLVLKTTGSAFHGFIRDDYTTLGESWDRILSTEVDASWEWVIFKTLGDIQAQLPNFDVAWETAREITLRTFAEDNSASVQATMYKMANQILAKVSGVNHVDYSLPNKHYFEISKWCAEATICRADVNGVLDLEWHKGLKNTGKDAEVYAPQSNPNGLIKCTVSRPNPSRTSRL